METIDMVAIATILTNVVLFTWIFTQTQDKRKKN